MRFTRATFNTFRGRAHITPLADIIGWQEVNTEADRRRLIDSLPGYGHYIPGPDFAAAIPISWDLTRFAAVGPGHFRRTHEGRARVTPARGITWQSLRDVTSGEVIAVVNTHMISSAWNRRPMRPSVRRWRRARWREHLAALDEIVVGLVERGLPVTFAGDVNRHIPVRIEGLINTAAGHKRAPYDQLAQSPDLTNRGVQRGPRFGSDHHSYVVTYDLPEEGSPVPKRGFCPFAVTRNIPPGVNDPPITPRVAILHVDAGNADSLFDFFNTRSGGVESHFFVKKSGIIEQYRSIFFQADANLRANDFAVSIETQGFGEGQWTDMQIASIKRLLLWLRDNTEIPLRKVHVWNGSGVGYHTLFGAPSEWTPVAKSCPGPQRIVQFDQVLVPWMRGLGRPGPPDPEDPVENKVTEARAQILKALKLLDEVDPKRTAVHRFKSEVRTLLDTLPDK